MLRLRFSREGTYVNVQVRIWVGQIFTFKFDAGAEWAAMLLVRELDSSFERTCARMREDAYNQGWTDKRTRRAKAKSFTSWFGAGW
jgi:hypothetical protein